MNKTVRTAMMDQLSKQPEQLQLHVNELKHEIAGLEYLAADLERRLDKADEKLDWYREKASRRLWQRPARLPYRQKRELMSLRKLVSLSDEEYCEYLDTYFAGDFEEYIHCWELTFGAKIHRFMQAVRAKGIGLFAPTKKKEPK